MVSKVKTITKKMGALQKPCPHSLVEKIVESTTQHNKMILVNAMVTVSYSIKENTINNR